jgi:polyhydroxybutyrate depolymerase
VLHGAGGTGEGVIRETAWDQKAEQEGFLVVFPNAMRVNQEADPSFLTNLQMWNDGSNRGLGLLSDTNDVKYLSLVLDDLAKAYAIDQKAIFITGFSSGASMLFRAADEMPGRFAAIAPVSGHYWPPSTPPINQSPIPTILIVGTADPINPFAGGVISLPWGSFEQPPFMNTILSWAKRNGFPQGLSATAGKPGIKSLHAIGENPDWFRVYIVEGLGHMWPGGEAIFPESFIGKDPGTLQATELIWQYFSQVRARSR